jgi:hypothetical protein
MAGLYGKFFESTEEYSVRSPSRIKPEFGPSGSEIYRIVEHMIGRA